jgi:hypothetical protein
MSVSGRASCDGPLEPLQALESLRNCQGPRAGTHALAYERENLLLRSPGPNTGASAWQTNSEALGVKVGPSLPCLIQPPFDPGLGHCFEHLSHLGVWDAQTAHILKHVADIRLSGRQPCLALRTELGPCRAAPKISPGD